MKRTALLVGAGGVVGQQCLNRLLAEDIYDRVTVFTRRPVDIQHPKLETHVFGYDRLDRYADKAQADDVFCTIGGSARKLSSKEALRQVDLHYPLEVAKMALRNGAQQFVMLSSLQASPRSLFFQRRIKALAEQGISQLNYTSVQIFRTSLLERSGDAAAPKNMGDRLTDLLKVPKPLLVGPLRQFKVVKPVELADAMVAVAKQKPEGINVFGPASGFSSKFVRLASLQ